jgi:hypothetical protein
LAASDTQSPKEIGAALARDFIQAQWLRIHSGNSSGTGTDMPADEMDNWCPLPRIRFRVPPWWQRHDLVIDNDDTLFAIYRSFESQLTEIARSSDDPALNQSISLATEHIGRILDGGYNPKP